MFNFSKKKQHQNDVIDFTHCFGVSNIDFEQVHTDWGNFYQKGVELNSSSKSFALCQTVKIKHCNNKCGVPSICLKKLCLRLKVVNTLRSSGRFTMANVLRKTFP